MKILAIDTTGNVASAAIADERVTIAELSTNLKKTHSETLLPIVRHLFELTGLNIELMDYIACSCGPGSFTGLRIGAAAAKGLAFGSNKRIIPVPTLDALAYNVFNSSDKVIVPLMDARRGQAYTAYYAWQNGGMARLSEYKAEDTGVIIEELRGFNRPVIFLGDGVPVFEQSIIASGLEYSFAPAHLNMQRAASVGSLAFLRQEQAVDGKDFVPFYLRVSQAEREYVLKTGENI